MEREELYHWQDKVEDVEKCNEVFEKFKAAGLLNELKYIIEKKMQDVRSEDAYLQTDFSGRE